MFMLLIGRLVTLLIILGSRLILTFTGSSVSWITYQDQWLRFVNVYIDGVLKTTIDNFASPARAGINAYNIGGLGSGAHTITIEATGSRNSSAQGAWVWVDAFDVTP